MRVHGDKIICRSTNVQPKSPYGLYKEELRNDFKKICGYCGKSEVVTKNAFEIDHFIPIKYAKEKEEDYTNLVYSCYECNRKKSSKWPSRNKEIQFDEGKGFVDPTSVDYDLHMERNEFGDIIGKTVAGKYMVEVGFEFDKRPMREIYKAMLLIEKKQMLKDKLKEVSSDEMKMYIMLDTLLDELQSILFTSKE